MVTEDINGQQMIIECKGTLMLESKFKEDHPMFSKYELFLFVVSIKHFDFRRSFVTHRWELPQHQPQAWHLSHDACFTTNIHYITCPFYLFLTTKGGQVWLMSSYGEQQQKLDRFRSRTRTSKTTWKWRVVPMYGYATSFWRRLWRPRPRSKYVYLLI